MNITVEIDKRSGVCGGVKRATKMIEEEIKKGSSKGIYVNGELLHNRLEMERLVDCGLKVEEQVDKIFDSILFIRTHGVSNRTIDDAEKNNNLVIDATCPKVSNSQRIIEKYYKKGYQIIIVGKRNHPEVKGLLGYCDNKGLCVMKDEDVLEVEPDKKTLLIAQTTVATGKFNEMTEKINKRVSDIEIANTICPFVEKRESELIDFAKDHDVVIFIGGRNSSNTKVMFEKFSRYNQRSYLIENKNEIDFNWFRDNDIVGVSGSASTPGWQIEEVKSVIINHFQ